MAAWNLGFCIAVVVVLHVCDAQSVGHCPDGRTPLPGAFCGLGPFSSPCPDGYFCNSAPNDAYAECCPTHCGNYAPLIAASGKPVHCGIGGVRCPDTYTCKVAPADGWAVCCSK